MSHPNIFTTAITMDGPTVEHIDYADPDPTSGPTYHHIQFYTPDGHLGPSCTHIEYADQYQHAEEQQEEEVPSPSRSPSPPNPNSSSVPQDRGIGIGIGMMMRRSVARPQGALTPPAAAGGRLRVRFVGPLPHRHDHDDDDDHDDNTPSSPSPAASSSSSSSHARRQRPPFVRSRPSSPYPLPLSNTRREGVRAQAQGQETANEFDRAFAATLPASGCDRGAVSAVGGESSWGAPLTRSAPRRRDGARVNMMEMGREVRREVEVQRPRPGPVSMVFERTNFVDREEVWDESAFWGEV